VPFFYKAVDPPGQKKAHSQTFKMNEILITHAKPDTAKKVPQLQTYDTAIFWHRKQHPQKKLPGNRRAFQLKKNNIIGAINCA
jgi:hypothetical protein